MDRVIRIHRGPRHMQAWKTHLKVRHERSGETGSRVVRGPLHVVHGQR